MGTDILSRLGIMQEAAFGTCATVIYRVRRCNHQRGLSMNSMQRFVTHRYLPSRKCAQEVAIVLSRLACCRQPCSLLLQIPSSPIKVLSPPYICIAIVLCSEFMHY